MGRPGAAGQPSPQRFSDELEDWLRSDDPTLGRLIDLLGPRGFAALFLVLLAVPALPLPTGGATHVLEAIAMLVALQLIVGRGEIWLPERWRRVAVGGHSRFIEGLLRRFRWLEQHSRARGSSLLERKLARSLFGLIVFGLSLAAFLAPPFSGLDTLPSLGAVILSAGVLLGDLVLALVGIAIGAAGVLIVLLLGDLLVRLIKDVV